jgi:exodeoxyribonuclease VII large subunit
MITSLAQKIDFQNRAMALLISRRLNDSGMALSLFESKMKDLSPLAVLKRGYSITRRLPDKSIVKGASVVREGDRVNVTLAEGALDCLIEKIIPE